jgi:CRP-like cAMP-binding protein
VSAQPATTPESKNRILAALPREEYDRLFSHLRPVHLSLGEVISEPGDTINFVYFPINAIIAVSSMAESGASIALGLIGPEGMVGLPVLLGASDSNTLRAVVQVPGSAMRMPAKVLVEEFNECGPLLRLLLRHTHVMVAQMSQTAVCNAAHKVDQRLCHWLLLTHDRVQADEFTLTHQGLADMIGTRRASVSDATAKLRQMGLISNARGKIKILDRPALESCTCECYGVIKQEMDHLYAIQNA